MTPAGNPASSATSASMIPAETGANSDGLTTTVFPAATGEMTARQDRTLAPFHGVKLATTPSGRRTPIECVPGRLVSSTSPLGRNTQPATCSSLVARRSARPLFSDEPQANHEVVGRPSYAGFATTLASIEIFTSSPTTTPPVSSNSSGRIVATDPAGHRRAHQPASDATIASSSTRRSIVAPLEDGLRPTTGNTAGRIRTGRGSSRTGRDT